MQQTPTIDDRDDGWGMTFAFWGTALLAGLLFAAVSLAPKLSTIADLDRQLSESQRRLVALERQSIELERVADALEHDPAFLAELAKLEFSGGATDGERIAVPAGLHLAAGEDRRAERTIIAPGNSRLPPAILEPLSRHRGLRALLLGTAVGLVLVAFLVLHERHAVALRTVLRRSRGAAHGLARRYQKPAAGVAPPPRRRRSAA